MKDGLHGGEDIPDNHAGASGHAAAEPLVYRDELSGNPLGSTRRWRNDLDGRNRPDLIGCKCRIALIFPRQTKPRRVVIVQAPTVLSSDQRH